MNLNENENQSGRFGGVKAKAGARRLLLLGGVLAPALIFGGAHAGELRAKLTGADTLRLSVLASAAASDKHLYTIREADPLVPPKFRFPSAMPDRDITIAIYGSGDASGFQPGAVIRIAGSRATPSTVVLPKGVGVFFQNDDPFTHRLVGADVNRDMKPGEKHKFEPKGPGLVTFTDPLMPGFKAYILVEDGVIANRMPTHDGAIKITEFPGGEYTIKAFFEGVMKATATIKVKDTGVTELKDPLSLAQK